MFEKLLFSDERKKPEVLTVFSFCNNCKAQLYPVLCQTVIEATQFGVYPKNSLVIGLLDDRPKI